MKAYSFENWNINVDTIPFLFFVQNMEEMLFPYGHDSYKVPTLNFYFLCLELLESIQKIEDDVIDKGNLGPMFDELKEMFGSDIVAQKLYGNNFEALFYTKDDKGEYSRDFKKLRENIGNESSIKTIKKTLHFLINDMKIGDKYFVTLKEEINALLYSNLFELETACKLSVLCRLFLTEVINRGYSQEYIYSEIKSRYYSSESKIQVVEAEIKYLWSLFSFKELKYSVIVPIKRKDVKNLLERFESLVISNNDERLFGNSCRWIAKLDVESLDPEDARKRAVSLIRTIVSMKQYNSHISKGFDVTRVIVKEVETEKDKTLQKPVGLLSRGRTSSDEQIYVKIDEMIQTIPVIGEKFFNAINLHASAMESKNVSNQLLNLWTIIEVLVEVEKRNSYSKITQISNTLTTVLNALYVKSLMEQLLFDLRHCCYNFDKYLKRVYKGECDYERLVAMLICDDFLQVKTELVNDLSNYPLLKYRIEYYSKHFSDRISIKNFLCRHSKRLEWQIMRIYRNRNMIVHDGSHFPYIDLIVQNLHFYIDSLIDTINYYIRKGYHSLDVIYRLLSNNEFIYYTILEQKDVNKCSLPIGDDFKVVVLGNSYIH